MLLLRYRVCRLTRRPSPETGSSLILLHWAVNSVSIVNLLMLEGSDASLFEWQCSLCRELRFRVLSPAQTCSRRGSYLCHDLPSLCTFIYPRIVPSVISHLHHKLVKSHLRRRAHWQTVSGSLSSALLLTRISVRLRILPIDLGTRRRLLNWQSKTPIFCRPPMSSGRNCKSKV